MTGSTNRVAALVGRDQPLADLGTAYDDVVAGEPRIVVVSGAAGLGKTSLVEVFLQRVPGRALMGSCLPMMGAAMPFVPVIQALRDLERRLDAPERERLLTHLPAVFARLMPSSAGVAAPTSTAKGYDAPASGAGQVRLFESFLALLTDLSEHTPTVLVVEDVHWADRSTLDLVAFLSRNLVDQSVLLLVTVRMDDLPRDHPVRGWLAELTRLPLVQEVRLEPLQRQETARQLADLLGQVPTQDLLALVHGHSAGNPLFTEQLLPWAVDPGRPLPENLRDLVAARFSDLPGATRQALEAASVLGRAVDLDVLAAVLEQDEEEVEGAVSSAVDRQLLVPGPGAGYTFRHPLFREVLVGDLLPGRRRRLHARAARVLQERPTSDPGLAFVRIGHIARHWEAADSPALAFAAAVRAGLAAAEVFAFAEADDYLDRAVRLHASLPASAFDDLPVDQVGLLAQASQVAHIVGDQLRAVELADSAVELCTQPGRLAQLLERQGFYGFYAGLPDASETAYRQALALLPEHPPTAERARVLADLAMLSAGWSRMVEADRWATEAIDVARSVGARREEGLALNVLGLITCSQGDVEAGLAMSMASVEIAQDGAEPDDLAMAYINLTHLLGAAGRYDDAADVGKAGHEQLRRLGLAKQEGSFLQANVAEAMLKAGRWREAGDLLDAARSMEPRGMRAFPILMVSARLAMARGDLDDAASMTAEMQSLTHDHELPVPWLREMGEIRAELALSRREPQEAQRLIQEAFGLAPAGDQQGAGAALVWLEARTLADLAEQAGIQQDRTAQDRARALGRTLADRDDRVTPAPVDVPQSSATALTTRAELTRLAGEHDDDAWARAAAAWEDLGRGPMLLYTRLREAEALVLRKASGERLVSAVRRVHTLALEQGAALVAGEALALARWGRVDLGSHRGPGVGPDGSADRPAPAAPSEATDNPLTAREREVLAGLVAGRTNGEIATELFISVKTASVHVSNILRKLGVSGREEAARLAYRLGLAEPPS